jgi:hypothetical protein
MTVSDLLGSALPDSPRCRRQEHGGWWQFEKMDDASCVVFSVAIFNITEAEQNDGSRERVILISHK